jgi:type I restriction enzyme S subunit
MENWRKVALSEVCDLIAGYAFKSKDFGEYTTKVIKITHITPPSVDMDNLAGVNIDQYNETKLNKYIARKGDYVLAMTGATIGKIGRIEKGMAYINQRVLLFKPTQDIDKDYLYYILQQYEFSQYVISHVDSESAQPNISAGTIGKYEFFLPSIETQQKIGHLLRTYDQLVEANRQINDNLAA